MVNPFRTHRTRLGQTLAQWGRWTVALTTGIIGIARYDMTSKRGTTGRVINRRYFFRKHRPHQGQREMLRRRMGGFHAAKRMAKIGQVWNDHLRTWEKA